MQYSANFTAVKMTFVREKKRDDFSIIFVRTQLVVLQNLHIIEQLLEKK